jgi:hypothetical protein
MGVSSLTRWAPEGATYHLESPVEYRSRGTRAPELAVWAKDMRHDTV